MSLMDFSDAPDVLRASIPPGPIPPGTLAWVKIEVDPAEVTAKSDADKRYLNFTATVDGGDYAGKRIWGKLFLSGRTAAGNSLWDMTRATVKRVLEAANGAHPQRNPQGYQIEDIASGLSGQRAAIKVGLDRDGQKNDVWEWLSPIATPANWTSLCEGRTAPLTPVKPRNPAASAQPVARPQILATGENPFD